MAVILWDTLDASVAGFGATSLIQFDCVPREDHQGDATPTQHPIAEGASLSDHVQIGRDIVELEALVTNHPVGLNPLQITLGDEIAPWVSYPRVAPYSFNIRTQITPQIQSGGVPFPIKPPGLPRPYWKVSTTPPVKVPVPVAGSLQARGFTGGGAYGGSGTFDRVRWIYDTLTRLRKEAVRVQLLTNLVDYPQMIITSVGAPVEGANHILFNLRFTSVTFAETREIVTSVKKAGPAEPRAKKEEPKGEAPASPFYAGEEQQEKDRSILSRGAAALGL